MPALRVRPLRLLLGCAAGTSLVAFADALPQTRAPAAPPQLAGALHAAAFGLAAGMLLAVPVWVVLELASRWPRLRSAWRRLREQIEPDAADRASIVRRHARVVALLAAVVLFAGAELLLLRAAWRLQVDRVAIALACAGSVVAALAAALAGVGLASALQRPVAALDRRVPLPVPKRLWARYLVWVVLPAWLVVFAAKLWLSELPPPLLTALLLALSALTALWIASCLQALAGQSPARSRHVEILGAVAATVLVIAGTAAARRSRSALASVEDTRLGALGLRWLIDLSDFDRDGASPWLGQLDCAPFDPSRGPLAVDVPANGRDENCDGEDSIQRPELTPLFSGKLPAARIRRYNVVWIIIDGLRADHVGHAGYERPTTPQIDALAKDALVFEQAYAQSSATLYSFSSMFTGLNPTALNWSVELGRPQLDERHVTLAERFAAEGYLTAISLTAWTQRYYTGLQQGMAVRLTSAELDSRGRSASQRTSPLVSLQTVQQIERALAAKKPFFHVVYYHDTHLPYFPHPGQPSFGNRPIDAYDGEIAFVDRYVGVLIEYLKYRARLWDNTIVIVTSDHGEEFGEHGRRHHARTCYVESTHVPLLLRVPGLTGRRVTAPVALVDLAPTLLELTGVEPQTMSLEGQSLLVPALTPDKLTADRPIFCAVASQWKRDERFFQRAVRAGPYSTLEDMIGGRLELYDLRVDPREKHDLARDPERAGTVAELRNLLERTRTGNMTASW